MVKKIIKDCEINSRVFSTMSYNTIIWNKNIFSVQIISGEKNYLTKIILIAQFKSLFMHKNSFFESKSRKKELL